MVRTHGLDVSSHNFTDAHPTFVRPVNPPLPIDFIIQRTSYAMQKDERLADITPSILTEKVKGAYHYWSSGAPWKDQCDFFLELMDGRYDFCAPDFEKKYNGSSLADMVIPSMEYLIKYSGKKVLFYTNPDMWGTWFLPIQQDLLKYELWAAHYWNYPSPYATPNYWTVPGAENMRRDCRIWQYECQAQNGTGYEFGVGSASADKNIGFDFLEWLAIPPIPPPPPAHTTHICGTCGIQWTPAPQYPAYTNRTNSVWVHKTPDAKVETRIGILQMGSTVYTYLPVDDGWLHFNPTAQFPQGGYVWNDYFTKV